MKTFLEGEINYEKDGVTIKSIKIIIAGVGLNKFDKPNSFKIIPDFLGKIRISKTSEFSVSETIVVNPSCCNEILLS